MTENNNTKNNTECCVTCKTAIKLYKPHYKIDNEYFLCKECHEELKKANIKKRKDGFNKEVNEIDHPLMHIIFEKDMKLPLEIVDLYVRGHELENRIWGANDNTPYACRDIQEVLWAKLKLLKTIIISSGEDVCLCRGWKGSCYFCQYKIQLKLDLLEAQHLSVIKNGYERREQIKLNERLQKEEILKTKLPWFLVEDIMLMHDAMPDPDDRYD